MVEHHLNEHDKYLIYLVEKGMWERYGGDELYGPRSVEVHSWINNNVVPRIREELRVIIKQGFTDYFLILWDIMNYCRQNGIPVGPGRGSAGGSVVAYCLHITDIEPLRFGLIFERFLNDERRSMPDIDVDLDWARRQEVIEYLIDKYGDDRVAQIVTFGTLSAKALLDDVGRVLRIPKKDIEELKALIPEVPADGEKHVTYKQAMQNDDFVNKLHEVAAKEPLLIPAMAKLEGIHRHGSMHAGGIVIASEPMNNLAPTYKPGGKGRQVVQYEMMDAEAVGLLKMDLLGLRTITKIDWAEKDVRKFVDPNFSTRALPLDIKDGLELINKGDTNGIFQLEGTGITRFAQELRIDTFDDIVALLALYRPGPLDSGQADHYIARKHGREPITYPHPDLEPILKSTYGIIIFQEQVMQIAVRMCGWTMGRADGLRKAIGKKDKEKMRQELDAFERDALAHGYDPALVSDLREQIRTFGRYGFNKSHAVAYAYLTYWEATIKAICPAAFFAAWLNVTDDAERKGWIIEQAVRRGIKFMPPDINASGQMFTMTDLNTIRFGLSAIKGMGRSFVDKTIASREANGPFKSYADYCARLISIPADKKEALVGAGAFDFDPYATRKFLYTHARELNAKAKQFALEASAHPDSFAMFLYSMVDGNPTEDMSPMDKADLEKQYVNFHISADPMKAIREEIQMMGGQVGIGVEQLWGEPLIGGRIASVHTLRTKGGDQMAFVSIDDGSIIHEVTLFPKVWKRVAEYMVRDSYAAIKCKIGTYRGKKTLQALEVWPIDIRNREADLVIDLGDVNNIGPLTLVSLKSILDGAEPGVSRVRFRLHNDAYRFLMQSRLYNIKVTDNMINEIKALLDPHCVELVVGGSS